MKTNKLNLKILSLTLLLFSTLPSLKAATPDENNDVNQNYNFESYFELDQMNRDIDLLFSEENEIKVLDSNDQLVVEGPENDINIKTYVGISDLLTEIDGIQYYRLSFD